MTSAGQFLDLLLGEPAKFPCLQFSSFSGRCHRRFTAIYLYWKRRYRSSLCNRITRRKRNVTQWSQNLIYLQPVDLKGIVDAEKVTGADIIAAIAIMIVAIILALLFSWLVNRRLGKPGSQTQVFAALVARIIRWVIIFVGVAWALSFLGTDIGWFTITLALVIFLFILVARPLIESLAASVVLTTRPAYTIGDDIEAEGYQGAVVDITNRSTVLETRDGRRVHIPNTTVLKDTIVVFTRNDLRRTSIDISFEEQHAIEDLERIILDAFARVPEIVADPPPRVRARSLDAGMVRLSVRFWHGSSILEGNQALDQAIRSLQAALRDAAVSTNAIDDLRVHRVTD